MKDQSTTAENRVSPYNLQPLPSPPAKHMSIYCSHTYVRMALNGRRRATHRGDLS
jgi:hypothetical protein